MIKLNLGCGYKIKKGWVNVDTAPFKGVNKYYNLDIVPYPFKNNSVDIILMSAVLEHLQKPVLILEELNRILKVGGKLIIEVPHFTCAASYAPVHFHLFNYHWFDFFVETVFKDMKYLEEFSEILELFKIKKKKEFFIIEDLKKEDFFTKPEHIKLLD